MVANSDIHLILVSLLLLVSLAIRFWYTKGRVLIKDCVFSIRNFYTKAFNVALVIAFISTEAFNARPSERYNIEVFSIISSLVDSTSILFSIYILAPRAQIFFRRGSVATIMGSIYGKELQIIIALYSTIASATGVAIQIAVFSALLNHFFYIDVFHATILSGAIVTSYLFPENIKLTMFTDVVQLLVLSTSTLLFILLLLSTFSNTEATYSIMSTNFIFNCKSIFFYHKKIMLGYCDTILYRFLPYSLPVIFQKIFSKQEGYIVNKVIMIYIFFCILRLSIGIIFLPLCHDIQSVKSIPYIINIDNHLCYLIYVITIIAILFIVILATSSYSNSGIAAFIHDLCRPIDIFTTNKLMFIRVFYILIGILGSCIDALQENLLNILVYSVNLYTATVCGPLFVTILGFRSTSRVMLSGMLTGIISLLLSNIYLQVLTPIDSVVQAVLANLSVMMVVHYVLNEPGGWVRFKYRNQLIGVSAIFNRTRHLLVDFTGKVVQLFNWSRILLCINKMLLCSKNHYINYAVFSMISLTVMCLASIYSYSSLPSTILCSVAIIEFYEQVNGNLIEEYTGLIWHIIIFYTLVFSNSILVLISGCSIILSLCFITNITVTGILVQLYVIICILPAIALVFSVLTSCVHIFTILDVIYSFKVNILTAVALISAINVFIRLQQKKPNRPKELKRNFNMCFDNDYKQNINSLSSQKQYMLCNTHLPMIMLPAHTAINSISKLLLKCSCNKKVIRKNDQKLISNNIDDNDIKILMLDSNNLFDLIQLERGKIVFSMRLNNFYLLLTDVIAECNRLNISEKHFISLNYHLEAETILEFDSRCLRQVILNLIVNAIQYSESMVVNFSVNPCHRGVEVEVEDEGIGIPDDELEIISEPLECSDYNKQQVHCGRRLCLALVRMVILNHHGSISTIGSQNKRGSKFSFFLPLRQPISQNTQKIVHINDDRYLNLFN